MWDKPQRGLGFDGIITSLANGKQRGEDCMQNYFHDHFSSAYHNGSINDVEFIFIDKTDPSDPTRREKFWRNKFKTLAPYGLNVEE